MQNETNDICCPKFDPSPWEDKFIEWKDKRFIRDKVFTLFYMPIGFGRAMKRLDAQTSAVQAEVPDFLCLSDHTSPWNMDLYLAVSKEVPGASIAVMSGKYFTRVYEGPFKDTSKWMTNFKEKLKELGAPEGKIYLWYTTCPKCAKKWGKNYVVLFGKVE